MSDNKDILHALGRVEAQVENLTYDVKTVVTKRLDHHSLRIGSLERSKAKIWAAGGIVAACAAWLGTDKLLDIIRHL